MPPLKDLLPFLIPSILLLPRSRNPAAVFLGEKLRLLVKSTQVAVEEAPMALNGGAPDAVVAVAAAAVEEEGVVVAEATF